MKRHGQTNLFTTWMDVCQDKVKTMEIELDEEKSSVELLNDRVARSREQVLYFNTHKQVLISIQTKSLRMFAYSLSSILFQIDQLRGDLMKERSTVHDLEMDKSVLERQVQITLFISNILCQRKCLILSVITLKNIFAQTHLDMPTLSPQVKELRSRVADMETQSRPSAGITLLEGKVQELEERLHSEERCVHTHDG